MPVYVKLAAKLQRFFEYFVEIKVQFSFIISWQVQFYGTSFLPGMHWLSKRRHLQFLDDIAASRADFEGFRPQFGSVKGTIGPEDGSGVL